MIISVFDRVENIVGKRRKCWLPAFSLFPHNVLKRLISKTHQKVSLCGNGLKKKDSRSQQINPLPPKKNRFSISIIIQHFPKVAFHFNSDLKFSN